MLVAAWQRKRDAFVPAPLVGNRDAEDAWAWAWTRQLGPAPALTALTAKGGEGAYFDDGTTDAGWARRVQSKLPPWPAERSEVPSRKDAGVPPRAATREYLDGVAKALLGEGAAAVAWRTSGADLRGRRGDSEEQWLVALGPACFHKPGQARAWCADLLATFELTATRWRFQTMGARAAGALPEAAFSLAPGREAVGEHHARFSDYTS